MLEVLKGKLAEESESDFMMTHLAESTADSIKNAFLNDDEALLLGAETDSEITKLIDGIPEYDAGVDIGKVTESLEALELN